MVEVLIWFALLSAVLTPFLALFSKGQYASLCVAVQFLTVSLILALMGGAQAALIIAVLCGGICTFAIISLIARDTDNVR